MSLLKSTSKSLSWTKNFASSATLVHQTGSTTPLQVRLSAITFSRKTFILASIYVVAAGLLIPAVDPAFVTAVPGDKLYFGFLNENYMPHGKGMVFCACFILSFALNMHYHSQRQDAGST